MERLDPVLGAGQIMGIAPTMIQSVAAATLPNAAPRALDCSLDSRGAFGLGYAPLDFIQGRQHTIHQWQQLNNQTDSHRPVDKI